MVLAEDIEKYNAGYMKEQRGSISGTVFDDVNYDGIISEGYCCTDKSFFLCWNPFTFLIYKLLQSYFDILHEFIFFADVITYSKILKHTRRKRMSINCTAMKYGLRRIRTDML